MSETDDKIEQEKPRTSKLAIAALVLSIVGSCMFLPVDLAKVVSAGLVLMILGVVLSVLALAKSRRSKPRLAGRGYAIAGMIVVMVVLLPIGSARILDKTLRHLDPRVVCGTKISGLAKSMMVYANDDALTRFPESDQWCDLLLELDYVSEKQFVCPEAREGRCHYAMNPNAGTAAADPDMVLLFETKAGWNQSGGPEILTTENHRGEGCNVAFVDTYVEFVDTRDLGKLKWKVEQGKDE